MGESLSADLGMVSLASLLQLAESEQLTGAFRVQPEGSIVLYSGDVVGGVYGRMTGLNAVLTLLMVRSEYTIFDQYGVEEAPVLVDMMALLLDGARLNDDWGNLAARVLRPRGGVSDSHSLDVQRVLRALDGRRIVDAALAAAKVDIIVVIDVLLALWSEGELKECGPPRPELLRRETATSTPAPRRRTPLEKNEQPKDFFELLDASRAALRSKKYGEARGFLEAAATLRPEDRMVTQNLRRIRSIVEQQA